MKLLIVDDEEKIRALIAKYAAFDGYTYVEAANGMEAVEIARTQPLDLVMIEVQSGEYLGEDDIVRFQDIYGRA